MRILFISPEIEEKSRGIGVILKSLIASAKADGHEVGLLVGYPDGDVFDKTESIEAKIEHLHLQHYLKEGRSSFRYILPGGYSKRNILKEALKFSVFRTKKTDINPEYLSGNPGMLNNIDFAVRSPFIYQFMVRNHSHFTRFMVKKVARKYDVDLVISAAPTILRSKDVGKTKLAHFVHDVMPIELVEAPPDNNTPNKYAKQFFTTATKSDLLMTNSEDTARKVTEINPSANVHVLYGTASSKSDDVPGSSILENKNLKPQKYLLFASTLEKRKNVENLFEAYALVAEQIHMPLVLVGAKGYGFDDIVEKYHSLPDHVKDNIIFTGYIPEADKYALFENAFAFVFPSIYEGIGLVIFEAMLSNIPVITSSRGALPEAGGNAALYVDDPYDPAEIADKILELYKSPKLRREMVKKGQKVVKKFTAEKFEERFSKAIKSLE